MKSRITAITFSFMMMALVGWSQNDEGFIYGKVYTKTGNNYQGQIRWGKEEAYWSDMMNAAKVSNYYESVSKYKQESEKGWFNFDKDILKIWEDKYSGLLHQFTCRFGDIKAIELLDDKKVVLRLKNNHELQLDGKGYNDIGTDILIVDEEFGEIDIDWDQVTRVEFSDTPVRLNDRLGAPLYGEAQLVNGKSFEGYIQWDHDERLGSDLIQGKSEFGSMEIPLSDIASIENMGDESFVSLFSGRTMTLSGTNDVNRQNRGIIITVKDMGRIDIPWSEFDRVDFVENHEYAGPPYRTYHYPHRLKGMVKAISGDQWEGLIVFDKDERWDVEHLDGNSNKLKYAIPFRNIKSISPKNFEYSHVVLRNGQELLLGDSQDVSAKNEGLLVFMNTREEPEYIPWNEVDEIIFE